MNLSIEELETIKSQSYQKGYEEGQKCSFKEGYIQGVDYSDSCLVARIDELEEELENESIPKSVIEDIKAEIKEELITHGQVIEGEYFSEDAENINFGLNKALEIINNHIRGRE